jgi:hypothetical protein
LAGVGLGVLALGGAILLISLPVEGLARLFGITE